MRCTIKPKNGSLYLTTGKADAFISRRGQDRYFIIMGTNQQQKMFLNKKQARALCLNLLQMFPDILQNNPNNQAREASRASSSWAPCPGRLAMDLCEYNPIQHKPATNPSSAGDCDRPAEPGVGEYHLCRRCAELPEFRRFKKRELSKKPPVSEQSAQRRA
jgi:hypothetical protein